MLGGWSLKLKNGLVLGADWRSEDFTLHETSLLLIFAFEAAHAARENRRAVGNYWLLDVFGLVLKKSNICRWRLADELATLRARSAVALLVHHFGGEVVLVVANRNFGQVWVHFAAPLLIDVLDGNSWNSRSHRQHRLRHLQTQRRHHRVALPREGVRTVDRRRLWVGQHLLALRRPLSEWLLRFCLLFADVAALVLLNCGGGLLLRLRDLGVRLVGR